MISENINKKFHLAKCLFDYLYLRDKVLVSEAIIGFGHFDNKIPIHCGNLFSKGFAPYIIFTGGTGAGSAGLVKPEAQNFYQVLLSHHPAIDKSRLILEDKSTNTGENIIFSQVLLQEKYPELADLKKIILVANAYRQRRVWLACRKHFINTELLNSPPITSFEEELAMFGNKNEDLCIHLVHELERIKTYPEKGFIENTVIPYEIMQIADELKKIIQ